MGTLHRATVALFALALPAAAQEAETFDLDTIVLSGGLTPIEASRFGRSASVVTAEEIEARGVVYASEVLATLPGVSVASTGGRSSVTAVRIRGAEDNHTLVLIDGVEVSTAFGGAYDFSGLLAADIERIEVLRGPQSSIYGSNAIGGVISITTKGATEPGFAADISAEVGDDGTRSGTLALRQATERARLSFSASRLVTDGYDVSGDDKNDDGDDNTTLNARVEADVTDTLTVGATVRRVTRSSDFDDFNYAATTRDGLVTDGDNVGENDELLGSIFATLDTFDGRLKHELFASTAQMDYEEYTDGKKTTDWSGDRDTLRYRATVGIDGSADTANHTLSAAVERQTETFVNNDAALVYSPSQLIEQKRTLTSYVLEYRGTLADAVDLQASVRHDDNDDFKDFTSWALGASWRLPNGSTRLHASAGTGVQNPTMYEQFGYTPDTFDGNPDLKPEESFGWDIGIEQTFLGGAGVIDVTYFRDELTNEIATVYDYVTYKSTVVNQDGKSEREGVEVAASFDVGAGVTLGANYTWLDAEDPDGEQEVRRPEQELGLSADWRLPNDRTRIGVDMRHVAGLVDFDYTAANLGNRVDIDNYTVLNLTVEHAISDRLVLMGRVSNLTDEDYEEVYGYDAPGRVFYAGLRASF